MPRPRRLSTLDRLVLQADQALRTLTPGTTAARRTSPAEQQPAALLDETQRRHAAGLMRINHTGEVCAQALYAGQALTAKLPDVRDAMAHAAREEEDHLAWCEDRLRELHNGPSLLNPLFYGLSFAVGAAAGIAGDKWSLGFVEETERQVVRHLETHLGHLPHSDVRSAAILDQMRIDEQKHADMAQAAGAAPLPFVVRQIMQAMARVMTTTVYRV
ncbi:MAG: 2-polyprenyl-3-methyl-6-methoxy-1,4-benzoquinone monooxygenase [Pseudomonadota bacterium]